MKKIPDSIQAFIDKLKAHNEEELLKPFWRRNIFPVETDAQEAVQILRDLFLEENWYIALPVNAKEANTLIVDEILYKYSRQYRKAVKKYEKEVRGRKQSPNSMK